MNKNSENRRKSSKNSKSVKNNTKMNSKKINKKDMSGQKARNKKKKRKTLRIVLLVILLIILIAGGIFAYRVYKNGWGLSGMLATVVGHNENTKKELQELKVLILGIIILIHKKQAYYQFQEIHMLELIQQKLQHIKK